MITQSKEKAIKINKLDRLCQMDKCYKVSLLSTVPRAVLEYKVHLHILLTGNKHYNKRQSLVAYIQHLSYLIAEVVMPSLSAFNINVRK